MEQVLVIGGRKDVAGIFAYDGGVCIGVFSTDCDFYSPYAGGCQVECRQDNHGQKVIKVREVNQLIDVLMWFRGHVRETDRERIRKLRRLKREVVS